MPICRLCSKPQMLRRYSGKAYKGVRIDKTKKSVQSLYSPRKSDDIDKIRNVGIIAHIDAGKTTVTERLLYYSGITDAIGSVDKGTTITDYLAQERERGITIQSAAVSVHWNKHKINVIDTPGHIDFTVEVERALRVMDSAVGIIDAAAGVEAQTKTVWRQANRFNLPRIVFLNKMDKLGADVQMSVDSIRSEFAVTPLLTQLNLGVEKDFEGVVDLLTMNKLRWNRNSSAMTFDTTPLLQSDGADLYDDAVTLRHALIDNLADICPEMMNNVISSSSYDDISAEDIKRSLLGVTTACKAVPVLLGSALKNCAVQPLIDAVVDYLPNPLKSNKEFSYEKQQVCGFAFKTVHEKERGAVTFVRLYSGELSKGATVFNTTLGSTEKIGNLYTILGDQLMETRSISQGNIAGVTGINKTVTGDTLLTNAGTMRKYEEADLELPSLRIPEPVFMCSIEPYSTRDQKNLDDALKRLTREDPSLRVKTDGDTGQMVVSGMGELHLEIIKDRLLREYKLEVYLGPTLVAYRECIDKSSSVIHHTLQEKIDGVNNHLSLSLEVVRQPGGSRQAEFINSGEEQWTNLRWCTRKSINKGVELALSSGPLLGYPVVDCEVCVHGFTLHSYRTTAPMISAAVSQAIHKALTESGVLLSEPVMSLQIYCEEEHLGEILKDLVQRRAVLGDVIHKSDGVTVHARSPVATLVSYSTDLRRLSSGRAHFMMEIDGYSAMNRGQTRRIVDEICGIPTGINEPGFTAGLSQDPIGVPTGGDFGRGAVD